MGAKHARENVIIEVIVMLMKAILVFVTKVTVVTLASTTSALIAAATGFVILSQEYVNVMNSGLGLIAMNLSASMIVVEKVDALMTPPRKVVKFASATTDGEVKIAVQKLAPRLAVIMVSV